MKIDNIYENKRSFIWKIILCLVLIGVLGFIMSQKSSFLKNDQYLNDEKLAYIHQGDVNDEHKHPTGKVKSDQDLYRYQFRTDNKLSMQGTKTLKQRFVAQDKRLSEVRLVFNNPLSYKSTGEVSVIIQDEKGKKIVDAKLPTNMVAHNAVTRFSFSGDTIDLNAKGTLNWLNNDKNKQGTKVTVGNVYYVVLQTKGLNETAPFDVYLCNEKVDDENVLTLDGKKLAEQHLFSANVYRHFTYTVFTFFILAVIFSCLLILIPLNKVEDRLNRRREPKGKKPVDLNVLLSRIMFFLSPFASFYIICKISGRPVLSVFRLLFRFDGLLNMMIIGCIWWCVYTIVNRTKYTSVILTLITFTFGLANYMLLVFRNSPLIPTDITAWETGLQVVGTYSLTFNKAMLWGILLSTIWICLALSLKSYKGLPWKKRIAVLLLAVGWVFAVDYVIFESDIIEKHNIKLTNFKPKKKYKKYGYYLSFMIMARNSVVQKPEGYSPEAVKAIADKYQSDEVQQVTEVTEKTPNIIVVVNESYSDLSVHEGLETNIPYMSYFNSIKKNTVRGTAHVSVLGGSTANSEFEFLTGNTMQFLPFHSLPFIGLLKENTPIPSAAWQMGNLGYSGVTAFHPGMRNSYHRNLVYPDLGFKKHIAVEDLDVDDTIRAYATDAFDYKILIKDYEETRKKSKAPYYMFNVTIQNHGGYKLSEGVIQPRRVQITSNSAREEQAEQYLNLIKISDDAMKDLFDYFSKVEEPTIIVFFGDHQPRLGNSFYNSLYGKSEDKMNVEEIEKKYQVPFIIWHNYEYPEKSGEDISLNYLNAYLLDQVGLPLTGYDKYLLDLRKDVPVISDICYKDSTGKMYKPDEESSVSEKIEDYKKLQYNGLIDGKNRLREFFYLKGAKDPAE